MPTIYEDPDYWPDTCPVPDDDWTEEEEEEWDILDEDEDTD